MRVDPARGSDQAVTHQGGACRTGGQVHPAGDVRIACPADGDDPALLDSDAGLDHTEQRIDDKHARDEDVKLAVSGRAVLLSHPRADIAGIAPHRLVAVADMVVFDPQPQVRVCEPDPVARRRPEPGAVVVLPHRSPAHVASPAEPPRATRSTSLVSPGPQRTDAPARMPRRKPTAAARANSTRGLTRQTGK